MKKYRMIWAIALFAILITIPVSVYGEQKQSLEKDRISLTFQDNWSIASSKDIPDDLPKKIGRSKWEVWSELHFWATKVFYAVNDEGVILELYYASDEFSESQGDLITEEELISSAEANKDEWAECAFTDEWGPDTTQVNKMEIINAKLGPMMKMSITAEYKGKRLNRDLYFTIRNDNYIVFYSSTKDGELSESQSASVDRIVETFNDTGHYERVFSFLNPIFLFPLAVLMALFLLFRFGFFKILHGLFEILLGLFKILLLPRDIFRLITGRKGVGRAVKFIVNCSPENTYCAILDALNDLEEPVILNKYENRKIVARIPKSEISRGEDITIEIQPLEDTQSKVIILSMNSNKDVIRDLGKNHETIMDIIVGFMYFIEDHEDMEGEDYENIEDSAELVFFEYANVKNSLDVNNLNYKNTSFGELLKMANKFRVVWKICIIVAVVIVAFLIINR